MTDGVALDSPSPPSPETFRQRLLRHGASALTDAELLAVLLRSGFRDQSALELSTRILDDLGGIRGLGTRFEQLRRMQGLGSSKLALLAAAHEIACRLARTHLLKRKLLDRPDLVAEYVYVQHEASDQEVLGVLYLDVANRLIGERMLFRGTLSRIAVEPRQIIRPALEQGAAGILMFHTHTSPDPSPSSCDLHFTRRVEDAAALLGIQFVDHVIVASDGEWSSLRRTTLGRGGQDAVHQDLR